MSKSAYSIILSDEVVARIDESAATLGTNRSALINHVLAQAVNLQTHQQWAMEILQMVDASLGIRMRSGLTSGGNLNLRTSLHYKYKPTLQYTVELHEGGDFLGELRVTMRSENAALMALLRDFFRLWAGLEATGFARSKVSATLRVRDKRIIRTLRRPPNPHTAQELAAAIASYVQILDECVQVWFQKAGEGPDAAADAVRLRFATALPALGPAREL